MHDQAVPGKVCRELVARYKLEFGLRPGKIADPTGHLHRADVLALPMMRTAFGDEHPVSVLQLRDFPSSRHIRGQFALVACHQDGERRQRHVLGDQGIDLMEGLRVGYHQPGRIDQFSQGVGKLFGLADEGIGMHIQQLAQHQLLGQDQAALRCRRIDGYHHHNHIPRTRKVLQDGLGRRSIGLQAHSGDKLLQFENALAGRRAHHALGSTFGKTRQIFHPRTLGKHIGLIARNDQRARFGLELIDEFLLQGQKAACSIAYQHHDVALAQLAQGTVDARQAQFALIIQTGCVDDDDRTQGKQLHRLRNRIGGRALHIGDDG